MHSDTSEKGLESLIIAAMTGHTADAPVQPQRVALRQAPYGHVGWILGCAQEYDREYAVDLAQMAPFLRARQPEVAEAEELAEGVGLAEGEEGVEAALDAASEEAEA